MQRCNNRLHRRKKTSKRALRNCRAKCKDWSFFWTITPHWTRKSRNSKKCARLSTIDRTAIFASWKKPRIWNCSLPTITIIWRYSKDPVFTLLLLINSSNNNSIRFSNNKAGIALQERKATFWQILVAVIAIAKRLLLIKDQPPKLRRI